MVPQVVQNGELSPQSPCLFVFQILFWLPKVIQSDPKLASYNLN